MPLTDDQIAAQNPWWSDSGWSARDRQLRLLAGQPVRLPTDVVDSIDLDRAGVHVLRGQRQVGKSTDLKLLVQRALGEGREPRSIVYLTLDLIEDRPHAELANAVVRAKALARLSTTAGREGADRSSSTPSASSGVPADSWGGIGPPPLVLLDEVTSVPRWQTAVKALWDDGTIGEDVVVCTGSSAVDLQQGAAERLPGRRGAGRDHLILPQTFAVFARAIDKTIPVSPRLSVADLSTPEGQAALHESRLHGPALERALTLYLRFGGLPAAVAQATSGASSPSEEVKRVLYDSLVKEVQRRGASIPAAQALLARVLRSLGSRTDWSKMAREMDVPLGSRRATATSHHTLRDYIELLAGGYLLFVLYFWRPGAPANNLSNEKKVYFADPLLHTIALEHNPGKPSDIPALVENAVGLALYRRYEPPERLIESFISPDHLHAWRTARSGEIDFVAGPRRELDAVEIKYRDQIDLRSAGGLAQAHPGRPAVIATKDQLHLGDRYALVPARTLLWALGS